MNVVRLRFTTDTVTNALAEINIALRSAGISITEADHRPELDKRHNNPDQDITFTFETMVYTASPSEINRALKGTPVDYEII